MRLLSRANVQIVRGSIGAPAASQDDLDCEAFNNDARPGENSSAAPGDSGGPVLHFSDRFVIVGVTSGGGASNSILVEGFYATFNRQDTLDFLTDVQKICSASICAKIENINEL